MYVPRAWTRTTIPTGATLHALRRFTNGYTPALNRQVVAAGVKSGYHGTWPGLADEVNSDLTVTTDYRSVLSEVVVKRMGASSAQVFPGFTPETVGALL